MNVSNAWKRVIIVPLLLVILINGIFLFLSVTAFDEVTEAHNLKKSTDISVVNRLITDAQIYKNTIYIVEEEETGWPIISRLDKDNNRIWSYDVNDLHAIYRNDPYTVRIDLVLATKNGVWFTITRKLSELPQSVFTFDLVFLSAKTGEAKDHYLVDQNALNLDNSAGLKFELDQIEPVINDNLYIYLSLYRFNSSSGSVINKKHFIIFIPRFSNPSVPTISDISDLDTSSFFQVISNNFTPTLILVFSPDPVRRYYKVELTGLSYVKEEIDFDRGTVFITDKGLVRTNIKPVGGIQQFRIDVENIDTGQSATEDLDWLGNIFSFDYFTDGVVGLGIYTTRETTIPEQPDYFLLTIDLSDGLDVYISNITKEQQSFQSLSRVYASVSIIAFRTVDHFLIYRQVRVNELSYTIGKGLIISLPAAVLITLIIRKISKNSHISFPDDLQYPSNKDFK